ncbi:octopamine receptor beta-2R-like [Ptychodera flava]|uniref:octopamine receptor beta-2R-like n=1 Tax=Ptychodera flava TaxID=63121 RepID=UPI003969E6B4
MPESSIMPTTPEGALNSTEWTTGDYPQEPSVDQRPFVVVLKATAFTIIILLAIGGNILVVLAVCLHHRLRVLTNYLVVSLAFTDLLVGLFVMPFNASIELTGKWLFGRHFCNVWNSLDVCFCTASLQHLCCIAVDRYVAITQPFEYPNKITPRRIVQMICFVWISSFLLSFIPIHMGWYSTKDNLLFMKGHPEVCQFVVNKVYALISSSISFWIPCIIMIFTYLKIFLVARRQAALIRATRAATLELNGGDSPGSSQRLWKEHKAAKTLGIIMGVFIVCWLPFFLWYTSTMICGSACPYPDIIGSILFWIGYCNSALNPIIYAFCNRDFRKAFRHLLIDVFWKGGRNLRRDFSSYAGRDSNEEHSLRVRSRASSAEAMATNCVVTSLPPKKVAHQANRRKKARGFKRRFIAEMKPRCTPSRSQSENGFQAQYKSLDSNTANTGLPPNKSDTEVQVERQRTMTM